jgi:hypothetical protein
VAGVALIADAGTNDTVSNTTARSMLNKTHKALFVSIEKRIFFLLFTSLAIVPVPLSTRRLTKLSSLFLSAL